MNVMQSIITILTVTIFAAKLMQYVVEINSNSFYGHVKYSVNTVMIILISTHRIGANPEDLNLVNCRGPNSRKFSELCVLRLFLRQTSKHSPNPGAVNRCSAQGKPVPISFKLSRNSREGSVIQEVHMV